MTYCRVTIAALLVALVTTLSACTSKETAVNHPVVDATAQVLPAASGGTTSAAELKYFRGSIGSALGLQMKLSREGERLTGSYFYQKIGTKIDLRGSIDQNGNVVMDEFAPGGKQTGVFRGLWT
ncbi:MAG: hypothetical protein ABJB97_08005, partial [Acidobacteriota bacterium]